MADSFAPAWCSWLACLLTAAPPFSSHGCLGPPHPSSELSRLVCGLMGS